MNDVIPNILSGITVISFFVAVISNIAIQNYVHKKRGNEIPFFFFQVNAIIEYPEITIKENGKIGKWFYSLVIGFMAFMLSIFGAILYALTT